MSATRYSYFPNHACMHAIAQDHTKYNSCICVWEDMICLAVPKSDALVKQELLAGNVFQIVYTMGSRWVSYQKGSHACGKPVLHKAKRSSVDLLGVDTPCIHLMCLVRFALFWN